MLQYFDTHAHYDDPAFDGDREALLNRLHGEEGLAYVVNPGSDLPSSRRACALSEDFPFVYCAVGVHPSDAACLTEGWLRELADLVEKHPKVRAIGEIGLDYHYDDTPREVQQARFRDQMDLARQLHLPVVIHDREAHEDCLRIVREFPQVHGVFHCFSGSPEYARELLRLDYWCSFTGAVTFKNARRLPEVVAALPEDRLMIETDSPYLAPVPYRGRRNHSGYLPAICSKVAELRGLTLEEAAALTLRNGRTFFSI